VAEILGDSLYAFLFPIVVCRVVDAHSVISAERWLRGATQASMSPWFAWVNIIANRCKADATKKGRSPYSRTDLVSTLRCELAFALRYEGFEPI
jgi:hypothetical protein